MSECVTQLLLTRGSARIAGVLTPHVGETAARFHAERITRALLDGLGDAATVASTILPLPPKIRREAAAQVAIAWMSLNLHAA